MTPVAGGFYGLFAALPLLHNGYEIRESRYLAGKPRLEKTRFSGGVNLSASQRNQKRIDEAMVVYGLTTMPGILFCSPWVAGLLREAFVGKVPGVDARTGMVTTQDPRFKMSIRSTP